MKTLDELVVGDRVILCGLPTQAVATVVRMTAHNIWVDKCKEKFSRESGCGPKPLASWRRLSIHTATQEQLDSVDLSERRQKAIESIQHVARLGLKNVSLENLEAAAKLLVASGGPELPTKENQP